MSTYYQRREDWGTIGFLLTCLGGGVCLVASIWWLGAGWVALGFWVVGIFFWQMSKWYAPPDQGPVAVYLILGTLLCWGSAWWPVVRTITAMVAGPPQLGVIW